MRALYLTLAVLGAVIPYAALMPFLLEHGLDVPRLLGEIAASRVAAFGWLDVLISALALWAFVFWEGRRLGMRRLWLYGLATLLVGVSLALPLFLYARAGVLASDRHAQRPQ